jgi:hypothetical protein
MMGGRSIVTRVPIELVKEARLIRNKNGGTLSDAYRRIANDFSPTGRELKEMTTKQFLLNVVKHIPRK